MSDREGQGSLRGTLPVELQRRERALRTASEIIGDSTRPFRERVEALLEIGREAIGTDYATFSHVEDSTYIFEAVDAPADAELQAGTAVPLAELPNCKTVVETERTLVLEDVEAEAPELADPAWGIACYLGAPVVNNDDVYGTFCFYGLETRSEDFSEWDITFVELLSNWVGSELEHRERAQFLQDAKSQLEAAAEAGAVGTWEWRVPEDEMVTDASFARLFAVDPDAAREGTSLDRFVASIHEADRDRIERKVEEALETCGEYEAEYRVWNADGELRWVNARGQVECDGEGDPVTFPGALTDITERKQVEQEREELIERLEASNERLDQFAHAASHDLQEPLRMVSNYLQLIETRYGEVLDEDGAEFIEIAVDGADRMRQMIESLLEYSRIETQGNPFGPVDLNDVLADVLTDLQLQLQEHDAAINVGSLPRVEGDGDQLRQLFQNLLDNALEYSGEEPPHVEITAERRGAEWVISARDEGIGVDPDQQARIFEVFQRLHTREEHDGTGIGLALCRRIVERHGGEMWVESEPGEGATFSFTLPAVSSRDEQSVS